MASLNGDLKVVSVSGIERVWLLWVFRNFRILHFSVLSPREQRLITQIWRTHAATDVNPVDVTSADANSAPGELIGTIEGFSPRPDSCSADALARESWPTNTHRAGVLREHSRAYAMLAMLGLLLVAATYVPANHPFIRDASSVDSSGTLVLTVSPPSAASAQPPLSPTYQDPNAETKALEPPSSPAPAAVTAERPKTPQPVLKAPSALQNPSVLRNPSALRNHREVIVRATVDGEGHGHEFQVLRGDQKLTPAALQAAKLWHFQSCSRASGCEQLLKYTDYGGGATSMKLIKECASAEDQCYTASTHPADQ